MDEMQIFTIQDMMRRSGCKTLKEFEEYLELCQNMDEMKNASNEYKEALAELKAALENEETAEQVQELLSMPEVAEFLDGTDQLLQVGDALQRLVQGDPDAKSELLEASATLPDALQKMDWLSDDPAEAENRSKGQTNSLQELNDALAGEPSPQDPVGVFTQAALDSDDPGAIVIDTITFLTGMVDTLCAVNALQGLLADETPEDTAQDQNIRDIAADIREMITQLTDDADMRECIGADTADVGAKELHEALRRLERLGEENAENN